MKCVDVSRQRPHLLSVLDGEPIAYPLFEIVGWGEFVRVVWIRTIEWYTQIIVPSAIGFPLNVSELVPAAFLYNFV